MERAIEGEFMSYATEIKKKSNVSPVIEKVRLLLGLSMMISGLYFGLFFVGAAESLGFLSVLASPFVMVTDK